MLRKKKSTFDESELPSDGWIWGNNRGGGGAPLKDTKGNDVANLRKVLTGTIEVDHSPSPNSKQQGYKSFKSESNNHNNNNNINNNINRRQDNVNRRQEYNEDEDYHSSQHQQHRHHNNNNNDNYNNRQQNTRNYYNYSDDEKDNYRDNNRNNRRNGQYPEQSQPSLQQNNNNRRNGQYPEQSQPPQQHPPQQRQQRPSMYRNNRHNSTDDEDTERVIPGLNDHYNSNASGSGRHDPISPRYNMHSNSRSSSNIQHNNHNTTTTSATTSAIGGSPKKFMSGLREITGGGDSHERDQKLRKQQEYQDLLKQQIEEKKRKKEQEQREQDAIKKKELQEYLAQNNKHAKNTTTTTTTSNNNNNSNTSSPYKNNNSNNNNSYTGINSNHIEPLKIPGLGRQQVHMNNSRSDEYESDNSNSRQVAHRRGFKQERSDRDYSDEDENHLYSKHTENRRSNDRVVPAEEYEELSKLCERLLTQQEQLQLEVQKQSEMLSTMKKKGKSISGPSDHAPPRLINRSKSAIHTTRVEKELQKPAPIHGGRNMSTTRQQAQREKQEAEKERIRQEKEYLKSFEPLKHKPDKANKLGRPSTHTNTTSSTTKKPVAQNVGFGSKVNRNLEKLNNNNNKESSVSESKLSKQGKNIIQKTATDNSRAKESNKPAAALNGFAKLALIGNNSRASGGPVMVVHDEEEHGGGGGRRGGACRNIDPARTPSPVRHNRGGGGRQHNAVESSLELRGNSEYIPISKDQDGCLGGEQLEKLLHKSRLVRY